MTWIPAFAGMSAPVRGDISTVEVSAGASQELEAEGNCVVARRGGEQLEANWRSARCRIIGGVSEKSEIQDWPLYRTFIAFRVSRTMSLKSTV